MVKLSRRAVQATVRPRGRGAKRGQTLDSRTQLIDETGALFLIWTNFQASSVWESSDVTEKENRPPAHSVGYSLLWEAEFLYSFTPSPLSSSAERTMTKRREGLIILPKPPNCIPSKPTIFSLVILMVKRLQATWEILVDVKHQTEVRVPLVFSILYACQWA